MSEWRYLLSFQYWQLICLAFSLCSAETALGFLILKDYLVLQLKLNVRCFCMWLWMAGYNPYSSKWISFSCRHWYGLQHYGNISPFLNIKEAFRASVIPVGTFPVSLVRECFLDRSGGLLPLYIVEPREMSPLTIFDREANEIVWIEIVRGVTGLSSSIAGSEGCSQ